MYIKSQTLSCKKQYKDNVRTQFCVNIHIALHFGWKLTLSHSMQVEHAEKCLCLSCLRQTQFSPKYLSVRK